MKARLSRCVAVVAIGLAAACGSDSATQPSSSLTTPAQMPPTSAGALKVGDLVTVNVNGNIACSNPTYHASRVVAIGTRALILNDTLNPKGFTQADFERFAARFDTLVYPVDVGAFGEPTDIDGNGHIALVFTRAVNELTPKNSSSYVGGFTFGRDLFPKTSTSVAQGCTASNQGEYFYLLTPDPGGAVNSNIRSTGFVDSVTTSVIAHEFQHLINASRRIYVTDAPFEEKWLDEGLAHIAEELLFYQEGGAAPGMNLGVTEIRGSTRLKNAFNADMLGNSGRYRSYLQSPQQSSPYAPDDSLSTRGAAWSLLRYSSDRVNGGRALPAGDAQVVTGSGDITLTAGATAGEYAATLVNLALVSGASSPYTVVANGIGAPSVSINPFQSGSFSRSPLEAAVPALHRDEEFEAGLRARERELVPRSAGARAWFAAERRALGIPATMSRSASLSSSAAAGPDGNFFYGLVNSRTTGFANLQGAVGGNLATFVRDWSVSHIVDDVAQTGTQFQQPSWNWHSIYPALGAGGGSYPLQVTTLANGTPVTGTIVTGGAAYFRIVVPANGTATVSLPAGAAAANGNLQLVLVRTK